MMVIDRVMKDDNGPTEHGVVYAITAFSLSFTCGFVLPIGLLFLLLGIPYVIGFGIAGMVHILDLPEPVGALWYATLGSIGGIASGTWKWGYGAGLFVIVVLWPLLIIWPWILVSVLSWVVFELIAHWLEQGGSDG